MTAFFLKTFKGENKCGHCSKEKLNGYSLCSTHLEQARLRFAAWSTERRGLGKCCYCNRRSFHGWLRCKTHTLYNRAKCLAWNRAHPEHAKQQWELRKKLRDAGFCPSCREHRPLPPGYKRCNPCRFRSRQHKAGAMQAAA